MTPAICGPLRLPGRWGEPAQPQKGRAGRKRHLAILTALMLTEVKLLPCKENIEFSAVKSTAVKSTVLQSNAMK